MQKLIFTFLFLAAASLHGDLDVSVYSDAAILMNADTGAII